ncbi:MAG: InlB B-repeat-containing protein, partial [Paludibacteraceae bacterium]|nr:InlB B-repeat-containing protein [Paludibacteraceae bacterium]
TATAAETFEFSNWSGYAPGAELPVVTGSAEYTAVYTGTPRPYTITFQNFDGTVLQQSDVNYGTTPTYDGATPYRAKDAFYSYTFSEWSPAITSVTGEATYTAQYTSTTRGFTIQFVDYDGTVLEVKDVPRGQTPEYTGSSISRAATVDKTYTFNSWSPALVEVTEDAIYTATYNETPREYTITWIDGNGATLKTDQVAYGETPEYSGATPQKASTDDHSYVFNNTWLPAIVAVTGEATYTAQFNETERQYRVTWDAATNGGTCATEYTDFSYNAAIGTLPVASKEGHTFNGWFTSASGGTQITAATKVTADVTYHAQFTINTHSLAWNANGGTLSGSYTSGTVTYGITIAVPTVTRDGYIFDGWHDGTSIVDPASSMPDNDLTYTAQWTPAVASVIVNSATTYYATIDDAFTAANNATAASTLTLLQDVTVTTKLTYNNSNNKDCILDLNGHTLTSNTSEQSPLHINNTSVTFTITDGTVEKAGKLSLNSSFSTRAIFGVYVQLGTLLLNAGTIEVTSSTANTCGVTADQNGIFTMNGGIIHVKTTNGKEGRGVYLAGSVSINGGTVHVEAAGDGYGIKRDGGTVTINNGKFNISASGSTYVTNQASTNSKVVIRGGYYTTNNQ